MKSDKEILTSLLHTVQMGQVGIRSVVDRAVRQGLKQELASQLKEYDRIELQAQKLAKEKGFHLRELNPGIRKMADMMSRARLIGGEVDSKIAGMLIQGNTRGMILGEKNLHRAPKADPEIRALADHLLTQEHMHIQKSQPFL